MEVLLTHQARFWLPINKQVLDLQANSLSGPLPQNLCSSSSRLEMLQVRNNRLSGPLTALSNCSTLTLLDVSGNRFSGTLPDVSASAWSRLVVLDASYNQLTGPIPSGVYHLPVLTYLSLSHNRSAQVAVAPDCLTG